MSNNVATHIKTGTETVVEESREKTIDEHELFREATFKLPASAYSNTDTTSTYATANQKTF